MLTVYLPEHYLGNLGGAMVERAANLIADQGIVQTFLHQFADTWDKGVRYGSKSESFWHHVAIFHTDPTTNAAVQAALVRAGLS